jgi:hypothetical protein
VDDGGEHPPSLRARRDLEPVGWKGRPQVPMSVELGRIFR